MSIQDKKTAEDKWERHILLYLSGLYKNRWIPSHDLTHHKRVWQNAKDLTRLIEPKIQLEDSHFYEKLILSCFFHDTGLLQDTGELHGTLSRKFCEDFLRLHKDKIEFDTTKMLEAIENHDRKNYKNISGTSSVGLFEILSMADDFDAFGAIGAYRYIEIYLLRLFEPNQIAEKILYNAAGRYRNFVQILNKFKVEIPFLEPKYEKLRSLFLTGPFLEYPVTLVDWVNECIVKPRNWPEKYLVNHPEELLRNQRIISFILGYRTEETMQSF
jgi:HD superfamily phosphodiesterase